MLNPLCVSYLLAAVAVAFVLHFHLLAAAFAGLAVHVLTVKLAGRLPDNWSGKAHAAALGAIVLIVMLGLFAAGFGLWYFLRGHHGMAALLATVAETLEKLKRTLPDSMLSFVPDTVDDLREQITDLLREHGRQISTAGMAGFKAFAHVLSGYDRRRHDRPCIISRPSIVGLPSPPRCMRGSKSLAEAFDKGGFCPGENFRPQYSTHLGSTWRWCFRFSGSICPWCRSSSPSPLSAGLIPVLGNLISNTLVVLVSLSVSPGVAAASLIFLVAIHKLEYFTNARIIGGEVDARAWELLCAMLAMEAVFGVAGLVSAPVAYAWIKAELKAKEMI